MRRRRWRQTPRASDSTQDPKRIRALRGDLDNIIAMALRRSPEERYQTVDQFAQDLKRYLSLQPGPRPAFARLHHAHIRAQASRLPVAAAATVLMVLTGAVVMTTQKMIEARAGAGPHPLRIPARRSVARLFSSS